MNIHEYQGKEIFRSMGVAVPEGRVAFTAEEAVEKAKELNSDVYVVISKKNIMLVLLLIVLLIK